MHPTSFFKVAKGFFFSNFVFFLSFFEKEKEKEKERKERKERKEKREERKREFHVSARTDSFTLILVFWFLFWW